MQYKNFSGQQPKEKNTAMKTTTRILALVAALLLAVPGFSQNFPGASGNPSVISRPAGIFYAAAYNWDARVVSGNSATGSQSIVIVGSTGGSGGIQLQDGTTISLQTAFSTLIPVIVDWGQGNQETVTPTAVSVGTCPSGNLGIGGGLQCATITASFNNTHGQSAVVRDATFGLQTAINYLSSLGLVAASGTTKLGGGGMVSVDAAWSQMGGTDALLNAAVVYPNVSIQDTRSGIPRPICLLRKLVSVFGSDHKLYFWATSSWSSDFGVSEPAMTNNKIPAQPRMIGSIAKV